LEYGIGWINVTDFLPRFLHLTDDDDDEFRSINWCNMLQKVTIFA